jgi:hypothetical protein
MTVDRKDAVNITLSPYHGDASRCSERMLSFKGSDTAKDALQDGHYTALYADVAQE